MANPPNISLEIRQQLLQRLERICVLAFAEMAVITLPRLVVVSKDALSADDICQPVLVQVRGTVERRRQLPDHDFGKLRSRVGDSTPYKFSGLHRREV
jgi:hypothetical protein